MTTATSKPSSTADGVAWNLSDLYGGLDDPKIEADHAAAEARAKAFAARYRGKVAGLSAAELRQAVAELQDITELMDAPVIYAHLRHAAKSDDPAHGRLLSRVQERSTSIRKHLIFFELEWIKVDDAAAAARLADPALRDFAYYLQRERAYKPHRLEEGEEHIMDEKANTGAHAFARLFDEITSRLTCDVTVDGQTKTLNESQTLALLYESKRDTRRAAAEALTASLTQHSHALTYIFNIRVQDHAVDDRLRKYPAPMAARNLANEIEQPAVDALIAACEAGYPIVQRYYRLKRELLGLDALADYDRYAPIRADLPAYAWPACVDIVADSYAAFSPTLGDIARRCFAERWIDAELRQGKRGGAFSAGATTTTHPYILCNYTDKIRDVMTVAHELGHTVHQYLSQRVGYLQAHTPLTTAETASVFGEMLVFRRLLDQQASDWARLALLASKIEDAFATVFRQIVLNRFEQSAHVARRAEGELDFDRIGQLWIEANAPMHGDAVTLTENYRHWWSYIPHFIHSPFYTYAYSFGELLVLALVKRYEVEGASFVPKYVELLGRGGSVSPVELLKPLGIDLADPQFWNQGMAVLDEMVCQAEAMAAKLA
ncbi:MAG: M3 family oligoendopeptidase [Actinobacteria bacterium]|nr:M3 family oligoendopeptidase [Actinomycetota bacterium]